MKVDPLQWLRSQFPSLATQDDVNGRPRRRIYLDNPAGTQVPANVSRAISDTILHANANLGGAFPTSQQAGRIVVEGHRAMADFLGCSTQEIVIGQSMTSLTYNFSRTIGRSLRPGDEIIVTTMDHEGNVAPWLQLAEDKGLKIRKLGFDKERWQIRPKALEKAINKRTKLLALNYSSNLTGAINDVKRLVGIARDAGVMTYVDAVQQAPHALIDVRDIGCDFLVCSSYKFYGPHLGILYGRKKVLEKLDPYKCRCATNELPYRFEHGTPQIELIAGLTAAVDHFAALGEKAGNGKPEKASRRDKIKAAFRHTAAHEAALARQLIDGLSEVRDLTIQGITDPKRMEWRVPTVSFILPDITPQTLTPELANEGIFCWSGHNYAWEVVKYLGIRKRQGVVRIGIANYNTQKEIDETVEAVQRNIRMLRQEL